MHLKKRLNLEIAINQSLENRIKSFLPTSGVVQSLMVTEKQYNDMHFLVGDPVRDVRNSSDRTVIL